MAIFLENGEHIWKVKSKYCAKVCTLPGVGLMLFQLALSCDPE